MGTLLRCLIVVPLAALLVACGGQDGTSQAAETGGSQSASVDPASGDAPAYDLARGEAVFSGNCLSCHGEGVYDAPRLGNAADWEARVGQPLAKLIEHAIQGHGRMPPKGGFSALSDAEVSDAVAYVVHSSKKIILALKRQQHRQDCHPVRAPEKCQGMDAEEVLTLQMLWLLGAPGKR
jgi:cytochrome c5